MFSGGREKWCIGNEWVNQSKPLSPEDLARAFLVIFLFRKADPVFTYVQNKRNEVNDMIRKAIFNFLKLQAKYSVISLLHYQWVLKSPLMSIGSNCVFLFPLNLFLVRIIIIGFISWPSWNVFQLPANIKVQLFY